MLSLLIAPRLLLASPNRKPCRTSPPRGSRNCKQHKPLSAMCRASVDKSEGVLASSEPNHTHGCQSIQYRSVSNLAEIVVTPALQGAVDHPRASVIEAGRNRGNPAC